MLLLKILIAFVLLMIFAEDMRSRSVHWYLFPLLALELGLLHYWQAGQSLLNLLASAGLTLLFLFLQLALVTAYFSFKNKRFTNITAGLLGWGDVLLLTSLTCYLPLLHFIVFYIGSLVVILLFWIIYQKTVVGKQSTVPLAGLQSLLFVLLLAFSWLHPDLSLVDDSQLIQLLSR
ncbi:hypothetical protein [Mucilaginibacter lacusdianchii]|uniref:hypothetical protein n=1 Tax=Mucilaginibacter lacusdianchii TaxID=2684211 RepID=UPI00131DF218|nr:hypothetical protein [Mucilaginibacter sp. JXJ CY 39]